LTLSGDRQFRLPVEWRRPFEYSFGRSFERVAFTSGPMTDGLLASQQALALAIDNHRVWVNSRVLSGPFAVIAPLLGHELAHTVQLAGDGDDSVDCLEAEAWEAARAALGGRQFVIKGSGRNALAAAGLYMSDAAREFMETFGIAPLLAKGNTAKIDPLTFEKILDLMTDKFKNEDDFIIDAHGHASGFGIPIAKGEQAQATTQVLGTLTQIAELRSAVAKAGNDLQALQKIVEKLPAAPSFATDPNNPAAVASAVQENKKLIERKIFDLKKIAGVQNDALIATLAKKMADLKKKQRNRIELRTCNMGHNQGVMDFFRVLFNAKILRATTNFSAFGHFIPAAPRSEATYKMFVKQEGKIFPDTIDGETFAFAYKPKPNAQADIPSAATSDKGVLDWIKKHIGKNDSVKASKFPTHFLLTAKPAFPLDQEYISHIKESKAP
jgi:Domain of unknown function (DUF4157)